jgi:hypothetical protein
MYLDKTTSRISVRKVLDESHISYTPEQADELADALLEMLGAVEHTLAVDRAFVCENCGCMAIDEFCCGGCAVPKRPATKANRYSTYQRTCARTKKAKERR